MSSVVEVRKVFNRAGAGVIEDGVQRFLGNIKIFPTRHKEIVSHLYTTGSAAVKLFISLNTR